MKKLQTMILAVLMLVVATTTALAGMQEERKAFIQKMISNGLIEKVETPGSLPHMWVKPAFYLLTHTEKTKFTSVVYSYYITIDKSYNMVVLYDSQNGKKVGVFGEAYGGLKMY